MEDSCPVVAAADVAVVAVAADVAADVVAVADAAVAAAVVAAAAVASFGVGDTDFDQIPFVAGQYSVHRTSGSCYRLGIVVVDSNSSLSWSAASMPSCV